MVVQVDLVTDENSFYRKINRGQSRFEEGTIRGVREYAAAAKQAAIELSPRSDHTTRWPKFFASWRYRVIVNKNSIRANLMNIDPKAELVLYPTSPHYIFPVNANYLFWRRPGARGRAKRVFHPGTAGQDVFEWVIEDQSLQAQRDDILTRYAEDMFRG